jgi:hypothetical protein
VVSTPTPAPTPSAPTPAPSTPSHSGGGSIIAAVLNITQCLDNSNNTDCLNKSSLDKLLDIIVDFWNKNIASNNAIFGGVVAGLAVLGIIIVASVFICYKLCRRKCRRSSTNDTLSGMVRSASQMAMSHIKEATQV